MTSDASEKSRSYWQRRAATFGSTCGKSPYATAFIERLALDDGDSVFDMGCATGTLALPLARQGHSVLACDFSPNMIDILSSRAKEEDLPIQTKLMAWEDAWAECGIEPRCVDVAVASRSISFDDIGTYLSKLEWVARKKVAITVPATATPAYEPKLCSYLGRSVPTRRLDAKAFSALAEKGRYPRVSYIPAPRPMNFDSFETACMELEKMTGSEPLSEQERQLFDAYAREHFKKVEHEGEERFVLDYNLTVQWAFISWDL